MSLVFFPMAIGFMSHVGFKSQGTQNESCKCMRSFRLPKITTNYAEHRLGIQYIFCIILLSSVK